MTSSALAQRMRPWLKSRFSQKNTNQMSMAVRWIGMRIVALPLANGIGNLKSEGKFSKEILPLTYYHFHIPPPDESRRLTIFSRVTNKAADLWANFGKAHEKSWKRKIFVYGERLIDRIDFEELSLKSLDPSLAPRIGQFRRDGRGNDKETPSTLLKIPLYYPSSLYPEKGTPLPHMKTLLTKRNPHHRKGFFIWLIVAPLTAPFALVPIIPNLPFFYAAWRAWSHYKAWKASEYMLDLIEEDVVVPHPNSALDDIYASYPPTSASHEDERADANTRTHSINSDDKGSYNSTPRLLLSSDGIPKIIETFKLSSSAKSDLHRAIQQAQVRIEHSSHKREI